MRLVILGAEVLFLEDMKAITFVLSVLLGGSLAMAADSKPEFVTPFKSMPCKDGKGYKVHLTFDDGPESPKTEKVLQELESINAKRKKNGQPAIQATFLMSMCRFRDPDCNGSKMTPKKMKDLIAIVKRMIADGHVVGSHSSEHFSHAQVDDVHVTDAAGHKTSVTPEEERARIRKNLRESFRLMNELRKVVKLKDPIPFRFPQGDGWIQANDESASKMGHESMQAVLNEGYMPLHWDVDSWDWSAIKREYLPDSVLNQICSHHGGVVLNHDIQRFTANNIGTLIRSIESSGHEFATLDQIKAESAKENYVSFKTKAYWYKNCGGRIGDKDQAWASCEQYRARSSDYNNTGAVPATK